MTGVGGEHKLPGEYRKSQNWIGGLSLTDAVFILPHHDNVPELMSGMEFFFAQRPDSFTRYSADSYCALSI
ncbi:hypothetical protein JCM31826_01100 [Thermaurantimonas aggregans]|uniref:Uncharacterized protein n=1 Tax=Thermaurantimonas aggregans TaxID=2173829 RepID=A0A401XI03_9FLAO|nr:hypothetical protein JCM31826_01100 [Thermaurantimonas aggregans]